MSRIVVCVAWCLAALVGSLAAAEEQAAVWPAITHECRPWTRWWWLGSAVDDAGLEAELTALSEAGFGGVEITPIYGAKGAEDRFLEFLSPAYTQALGHACKVANGLDLGVDMATGTGWPFGGPHVGPGDVELRIAGKDGRFAPQPTRFKVKRAAPGGAGFVVNPYSAEALMRYVEPFTAALGSLPEGALRSQFHDSFEYQANWATEVPDAFLAMHGYPLESQRAALEGQGDPDTVARVKADYRATLAGLHLDYVRAWVEWAHGQGFLAREQAHGAPANLIDLYALSDIPETEVFGASVFAIPGVRREAAEVGKNLPQPLVSRMASSAAHLAGRRLVSSETFTWMREHFCEAPSQMKPEIDQLFLAGINHIFYHGTAYSPGDAAWPGWLFYASSQANRRNPLWRELASVNAFIARSQAMLQAGEPDNDLLIYWPIHDLLHTTDGWQRTFSMHNADWLTNAETGRLAQALLDAGLSFDFCSDALLSEAGRYQAVVVPPCRLMPVATLERLLDHAEQGGRVVFVGRLPDDVPGLGSLEQRRAVFGQQRARLHWQSSEGGVQTASLGDGQVLLVGNAAGVVAHAGGRSEPLAAAGIGVLRRRLGRDTVYFLANQGADAFDGWAPFATQASAGLLMDPLTGQAGRALLRTIDEQTEVRLQLSAGESLFVRLGEGGWSHLPAWPYAEPAGLPRSLEGPWQLEAIAGGPVLPEPLAVEELGSWTERGGEWERFGGTVRYTHVFDLEPTAAAATDDWRLELGDLREVARVFINGHDLGCVWSIPFVCRLQGHLRPGRNELAIEVTNLGANRIRDLDRRGVAWKNFHEINFVDVHYQRFDASEWPLKPAGLLGPVRLVPLKERTGL